MKPAYITLSIFKALKNKRLLLWLLVLVISAAGPLINTYLFSQGINALENSLPLKQILWVFFTLLAVASVEIFLRISSKTRIHHIVDSRLINLQLAFLKNVTPRSKKRKPTVQSIRNLTRSIQLFTTHFINNGVSGLVSFISVPFILYFIDLRIFYIEMALIIVYLTVTIFYSYRYEKQFERYDESREKYFIKMSSSNKVAQRGHAMAKAILKLQNIRFFEWASAQNIIIVFQFIITAIVVIDIVNGLSGISDLVLIIGYTNESKKFLNSITGDLNRFMQIKAGVERLVVTSHGAKQGSVISLT